MIKIINQKLILVAITLVALTVAPVAFATGYGPTTETLGATEITETSVVLNAFFTSRDAEYDRADYPILVFEYGETSSLGSSTEGFNQKQGSRNVAAQIFNLDEGETYYYRAVLYTDDGIIKGDKLQFQTLDKEKLSNKPLSTTESNTSGSSSNSSSSSSSSTNTSSNSGSSNTSTTSKNTSSVASTNGNKNLFVSIENDVDEVDPGEVVVYEVSYKNTSGVRLNDATLIIEVPEEMSVISTSGARLVETRSGFTAHLGDLKVGEEDLIKITGRMRGRSQDEQVIARVDIIYTIGSARTTETASAFDIDEFNGLTNVALGATAFGAGFFPTSLGGWAVIIGLILLIVYLVHRFYMNDSREVMFREESNAQGVSSQYS